MTTQGENAIKRRKEGKLENQDLGKGEKRSIENDTVIKKKKLKKEKQIQDSTVVDENSRSEENTNDNKELMKKKKKKKLIKDDLVIKKYQESITNQPTEENIKIHEKLVKNKEKKKEEEDGDDSLTHKNNDGHSNESNELKKLKRDKKKKDKITVKISEERDADQPNEIENKDIESEGEKEETKKKEPSKRQIKREKALLREEQAKEENKKENAKKALNYISKWKHAKSEWKFEKLKQIWLMDNLLNDKYVSDDHFPFILEYFEGCKGIAKKTLIEKAMKVIKKIEDNIEEDEEIVETTEYKRARQLLQALPTEA